MLYASDITNVHDSGFHHEHVSWQLNSAECMHFGNLYEVAMIRSEDELLSVLFEKLWPTVCNVHTKTQSEMITRNNAALVNTK